MGITISKIFILGGILSDKRTENNVLRLRSSWNVELLTRKLVSYEDREICKFLKYGFPVGYSKPDLPVSESRNHTGANRFTEAVDSFIQTELSYKAISGPFDSNFLVTWQFHR